MNESDADLYQGHQYTWIGWDELGNWPNLNAYKKLKACLRSAHGVANKRIRCSANPGGVGHHAIKNYFIDIAPKGMELIKSIDEDGSVTTRMFIPMDIRRYFYCQHNRRFQEILCGENLSCEIDCINFIWL